jgi:hypothetical protein
MEVQMEDGLPCSGTGVANNPELVQVAISGDLCCDQITVADFLGVFWLGGLQSGNVCLWYDQDVCRRLRVDVLEGINPRILIDLT